MSGAISGQLRQEKSRGNMFKAWFSKTEKKLCLKCGTESNQGWVDEETKDERLFNVPDFICSCCGWKKGIAQMRERGKNSESVSTCTNP